MPRSGFIFISAIIIALNTTVSYSQIKGINREKYRIHINQTSENITVDGLLDEEIWQTAEKAGHLQRVLPTDTGFAIAQTEVKLTYTPSTLYMGIICKDPLPGKRPVESLRRDFSFMKNDNFIAFIDTFNDQTNGFAFGVSPAGAQWDGVQADGGTVNLNWDIKWRSAVKNYDDYWVAEFAIPFRSIRYHGGTPEWGINFSRQDLKSNEKSSWAPMPRQFATATLAYTGSLVWDKPLPPSGIRFSLIPYVSLKATQDREADKDFRYVPSGGIDAKAILSTSLNLDLTINPDYSQVEVDEQQTNLDRYELFFPEKRQFYLENSDLFASLGSETARPFFSRRIGLENPVRAGARLSGKLGNKWRIGIMDIQTGTKDSIFAANYMVAAVQRQVFSRSSISAFLVNKQVTGGKDAETPVPENNYNRVGGLEYNLSSPDNKWTGKAFYHQDIHDGASMEDAAMAANIKYSSQYVAAGLDQMVIGKDYNAETGYVRRTGFYEVKPKFSYKFFPHSSSIANHGPAIESDMFFDPSESLRLADRETELSYNIEWLNRNTFSIEVENSYVRLDAPFDPTNTGGPEFNINDDFTWNEIGASFVSDVRRLLNFELSARYGGYYNGTRLSLNGKLNYRVQPYGSMSIVTSYNNIILPYPYNSAKLLLIGPRFDFTFTDKLFFTSFVQYNNQIDNLNLNLRFQWRFAPVSDLFIVYTENSYPSDYKVKNRGLVVKLSYWFN
jgi:hypothetical protein